MLNVYGVIAKAATEGLSPGNWMVPTIIALTVMSTVSKAKDYAKDVAGV